MYSKRNYGFWMTFGWSKMPFIYGLMYSASVALIIYFVKNQAGIDISLPWQPLSVLGISVAFYLGFKNNSSYDRLWEARKIWGGITNSSRSFGTAVNAFVAGEQADTIKKELIYRHIAWLTALRYQLRTGRPWEHTKERLTSLYDNAFTEKYFQKLDEELLNYLPMTELEHYKNKANMATQIMNWQSVRLQELRDLNYFEDFRHMEFFALLKSFYDEQGRSERIKNFPFPRQYASVALWTTMIFAILMPWGIINIFNGTHGFLFWVSIPLSALLIWIFFLMEKIGDYSENPFEGTYNDIPITSISRGIEIDLRDMINDTDIPPAITANENGYLM
ncbi:MAG: hypothetical protein H7X88_08465 [Gloeobacteraceae cyanobacterium ES-bin-316]|nr:hypothetical protein [Ferruginibacter sp.]